MGEPSFSFFSVAYIEKTNSLYFQMIILARTEIGGLLQVNRNALC